MSTERLDVFLLGFGSVGQNIVKLMLQEDRIRPPIRIIGISDSCGGVSARRGLPIADVLQWKAAGNAVKAFPPGEGIEHHESTLDMVKGVASRGDVILDGTPVDLQTGGEGLRCCRYAVEHGIHVVMANKAPLVLAYDELTQAAAREPRCCIEFSATVCGGLPVVNVGRRDLFCGQMDSVSGIFNSTSNYVLSRMEAGEDPADALRAAQLAGVAETDPSLDLDGYDTANKLVIICNSVLRIPAKLADVDLTGISGVSQEDIAEAARSGQVYRLIGTAQRFDGPSDACGASVVLCPDERRGCYALSVRPTRVDTNSFFGRCIATDMCVVFQSAEFETISMKTDETGVSPTSCAMLRDIFSIIRRISTDRASD